MFTLVCTVCLAFVINAEDNQGFQYMHPRSVMMGGYYGMPLFKYLNFPTPNDEPIPSASEEEFQDEREVDIEDSAVLPDDEKHVIEHSTSSPENIDLSLRSNDTTITKKINTKKSKNKPVPDEEDSAGSSFPFGGGNSSFFNTFFPIMLGGRSGVSRKSGGDDGSLGGATAIANSFSTGRGGVASSHATSFGDVYMSSSMRERNDRIRKKYD
ncbi:hypothetical protein WA026_004391 [Henosepilachna vigintioctopunctata]|uniref:Uncharacterized protein n=1 Tax=Henosepilachna vigintioctopunctata TaxID=420089 RepID=A0AAW1V0D8_9CUCU